MFGRLVHEALDSWQLREGRGWMSELSAIVSGYIWRPRFCVRVSPNWPGVSGGLGAFSCITCEEPGGDAVQTPCFDTAWMRSLGRRLQPPGFGLRGYNNSDSDTGRWSGDNQSDQRDRGGGDNGRGDRGNSRAGRRGVEEDKSLEVPSEVAIIDLCRAGDGGDVVVVTVRTPLALSVPRVQWAAEIGQEVPGDFVIDVTYDSPKEGHHQQHVRVTCSATAYDINPWSVIAWFESARTDKEAIVGEMHVWSVPKQQVKGSETNRMICIDRLAICSSSNPSRVLLSGLCNTPCNNGPDEKQLAQYQRKVLRMLHYSIMLSEPGFLEEMHWTMPLYLYT